MILTRVTITGADDNILPAQLYRLSERFPFVEWGFLISKTKEGNFDRYPSQAWVQLALQQAPTSTQFAAHFCGEWSRNMRDGIPSWAIDRSAQFRRFNRIQFNGWPQDEHSHLRALLYANHWPDKQFILQSPGFEWKALPPASVPRPAILLDRSGGRGEKLSEFPAPNPYLPCGYAGGIGPDNIADVLSQIQAIDRVQPGRYRDYPYWIDMESGVRTADRLDFDKVEACLSIAASYVPQIGGLVTGCHNYDDFIRNAYGFDEPNLSQRP